MHQGEQPEAAAGIAQLGCRGSRVPPALCVSLCRAAAEKQLQQASLMQAQLFLRFALSRLMQSTPFYCIPITVASLPHVRGTVTERKPAQLQPDQESASAHAISLR
jgi:hypothetical protein